MDIRLMICPDHTITLHREDSLETDPEGAGSEALSKNRFAALSTSPPTSSSSANIDESEILGPRVTRREIKEGEDAHAE